MKKNELDNYRCPKCRSKLDLRIKSLKNNTVDEGELFDDSGHIFKIKDGIPYLYDSESFEKGELNTIKNYDNNVNSYDYGMKFFFKTLNIEENIIRKQITDFLEFNESELILEIGCGTGSDSQFLLKRLNEKGKLYLQDPSLTMIKSCRSKLINSKTPIEFALTNSAFLPFDDGFFDATFHFGGLNTFSDIKKTFTEVTRVTKVGGNIVMSDEGISPWLRKTLFGKLLINSNPLFEHHIPLECLPENAKNVQIHWVAEGTFYVIKYTVGEHPPHLDLDVEFPGPRGGTYRTRYYGKLEGVKVETKDLATRASKSSGKSFHKWLDDVVKQAAQKELGISSDN